MSFPKKSTNPSSLAVLDGVDIVMMGVVEILDKLSYKTPIGHRMPAYCTALGKAMLAFQPLDRWDRLISMIEFVPRTENTITDPERVPGNACCRSGSKGYAPPGW